MNGRPTVRAVWRPLVLSAATILLGCSDPGPPRLEATRVSVAPIDPVAAPRGAGVVARFSLRNAGGRDLLIHGVVRDCGCELASSVPEALASGESATIDVACRTVAGEGTAQRELRVRTSDPVQPIARLAVPAESTASPPPLYFGYVAVGSSAVRDLDVPAALAAAVVPPTASDPTISVEAKVASDAPSRPETGRNARQYVVRFAPTAPGPMRAQVDLGGGVTIAVAGVGYGSVLAYPAEIDLGAVARAGGPQSIALKGVGEEPLDIIRMEFPQGLAGDLHAVTPGHEYRLNLRRRGAPTGSADDAIRIHTASASEPVLTIPVRRGDRS